MTLDHWLEQNRTKLLNYAKKMTAELDHAEDLVQEIIVMVLEGRIRLDLEQYPATYLAKTMWLRKWDILGDEPVPQWITSSDPRLEQAYALVRCLPIPLHQNIMEMALGGNSCRVIAAKLGIGKSRVHSIIQYSAQAMRQMAQAQHVAD
jgi:DNA-directed RNA polymerase specialized sigma24 family protein